MGKKFDEMNSARFYELAEERKKQIENANADFLPKEYPVNKMAEVLHPDVQHIIVAEAKHYGLFTCYKLIPDKEAGTEQLAPFSAGQRITIYLTIDGIFTSRRYSLSSDPALVFDKENGCYELCVASPPDFYFPVALAKQWTPGTKGIISAPSGTNICINTLRDSKHIVAVTSAISSFRSMAYDIVAGRTDCRLTILNTAMAPDAFVYDEDMNRLEKLSNGKIKIVRFAVYGQCPGIIPGVPTAEKIKEYAGEGEYSVFFSSMSMLWDPMIAEVNKLGLPPKNLRIEAMGEIVNPANDCDYPKEAEGKTFNLKVKVFDKIYEGECSASESLIRSCELLGIRVTSECRSGICGWCRSKLISGDVFVPKSRDGRREADLKFGWIHPCASYPLSDIEMEVFPK